MNQEKEVTIYDIARSLKISTSTVSRALNNNEAISKKTRKKILDKANEFGYRANNFASNLRTNKSNTIGVLVHELNSTFMINVLSGIESVIADKGYDIIIAHSAESGDKEVANARNLFNKRVDGMIASLAFDTPDLAHFEQFTKKKIPLVFFDRVEENKSGTKIIIDNYKGGYDVTQHLIEQGCKRIAHVTGNLSRNVYSERYRGYKAALEDNNIAFDESLVIVNDLQQQECIDAVKQLLPQKPDGLFSTSDAAAAICMQEFKSAGFKIPGDIAVAGFNNDFISSLTEPKLTTINYSGFNMGQTAANILLNYLSSDHQSVLKHTVVINSELIVRESTMRKK